MGRWKTRKQTNKHLFNMPTLSEERDGLVELNVVWVRLNVVITTADDVFAATKAKWVPRDPKKPCETC